ncbi:MAG: phosphatase PAP2 family protein [Bacteroidia bacterium]
MKNKLPNAFILPYILLLIIGAIAFFFMNKIEAHIFINQYHHPFFDTIFYYATYLGDGIFVVITLIIAAFFNVRLALLILASYALSAGITQGLKHLFFDDWMRPAGIFEANAQLQQLYLIPGVELNYHNSFPSGHSTSAFALFFSLSIFSSKKTIQFLLLVIAVLTAYSRVYLSQHFFIDIYAGSFIGTICSLLVYQYWIAELSEKYNQSLLTLIK